MIDHLRRSLYFSPVALGLAIIVASAGSVPLGAASMPAAQASPPVVICSPFSGVPSRIIQVCNSGMGAFEQETVRAWLESHALPPSDAALLSAYGRSDVRNEVRAFMLARLIGVARKQAADRTLTEQEALTWFTDVMWANEKAQVEEALNEYGRWYSDPCIFRLDAEIASTYGLTYLGSCGGLGGLFAGLESPDIDYFLAVGLKKSYGRITASHAQGAVIEAATGHKLLNALGVGGLAGALSGAVVLAGITSAFIAANVASIFPYAGALLFVAESGSFLSASALGAAGLGFIQIAAAGGPAAIVLLSVIIGVLAGIKAFQPDPIVELRALKAAVDANPPDIGQFATTSIGLHKLTVTFTALSLPEAASTVAPPTQPQEAFFVSTPTTGGVPQISHSLEYQDRTGVVRTATLVGGWFSVFAPGVDGHPDEVSWTPTLDFKDRTGKPWSAQRMGDNFLLVKGAPNSSDQLCPANPESGLSENVVFSTCSSYIWSNVELLDREGDAIMVTIARPLAFTSPPPPHFLLDTANPPFTVTTSGSARITLNGLPSGLSFIDHGNGKATLSGTPSEGTGGVHRLTLTATNIISEIEMSVDLVVGTIPTFTSVPPMVFVEGRPGSFVIQASGIPTPSIIPSPWGFFGLPIGVVLTDNGDGSATIGGTPVPPAPLPPGGVPIIPFLGGEVNARNLLGEAVTGLSITVKKPLAFTSAGVATFTAGSLGAFTITTGGATPQLTLTGNLPSGVSFVDSSNGTATLTGTPSAGTGGLYTLALRATNDFGEDVTQPFTLTVNEAPAIISTGATTFTVGSAGSFAVAARGFPTPALTLNSTLPAGVSFTGNSNGTATLSGTPAGGAGGGYALAIRAQNGIGSATIQNFALTVNEAPAITTAGAVTFNAGSAGSFTVATLGFPRPALTLSGSLPGGVTFTDGGDGTATLAGTAQPWTGKRYAVTVTAANGIGAPAIRTFTLTVNQILEALGNATVWIGVDKTLPHGRPVEVQVNVLRNGVLIGRGAALSSLAGDTLDNATAVRVPLILSGPALFAPGDTLSSQVLIRRGSGSGNTDTMMWYGSAAGLTGSTRFDATFGGVSLPVYYTGAACGAAKGTAPPCNRALNQAAGSGAVTAVQQAGKDFASFGDWRMLIGVP